MTTICPVELLDEILPIGGLPVPQYEHFYYLDKETHRCDIKIVNLKCSGFGRTEKEAKKNAAYGFIFNMLPKVNDSGSMKQLQALAKFYKVNPPEYTLTQATALQNLVKCTFMEVEAVGIGHSIQDAKQHATSSLLENVKINDKIISVQKETVIFKTEFRQAIEGDTCFNITRNIPDAEIDSINLRSDLENILKEFNVSYDLESYDFFARFVGKNCPISRYDSGISREDAEMRVLKCAIKSIMKLIE